MLRWWFQCSLVLFLWSVRCYWCFSFVCLFVRFCQPQCDRAAQIHLQVVQTEVNQTSTTILKFVKKWCQGSVCLFFQCMGKSSTSAKKATTPLRWRAHLQRAILTGSIWDASGCSPTQRFCSSTKTRSPSLGAEPTRTAFRLLKTWAPVSWMWPSLTCRVQTRTSTSVSLCLKASPRTAKNLAETSSSSMLRIMVSWFFSTV